MTIWSAACSLRAWRRRTGLTRVRRLGDLGEVALGRAPIHDDERDVVPGDGDDLVLGPDDDQGRLVAPIVNGLGADGCLGADLQADFDWCGVGHKPPCPVATSVASSRA